MTAISDLPKGFTIPRNLPGLTDAAAGGPDQQSPDAIAMSPYWTMVDAILSGREAMVAAGAAFLPNHPQETAADYTYRLSCAVFTNIFADIVDGLASKPFQEEIQIVDGSASVAFVGDPVMALDDNGARVDTGKRKGGLVEDIDGRGSHLHVFANEVFYRGIASGLDWIMVDYPKVEPGLTAAQERDLNIRPYWRRIPASCVLDVATAMVGGREEFVYFRYQESAEVRDGYKVKSVERVREILRPLISAIGEVEIYGPPVWIVWEKVPGVVATTADPMAQWKSIDSGTYSIGVIPIVPFLVGRRKGTSWIVDPPMRAAASLQVELYQLETGLKCTTNLVCYPMLAAIGVDLKDKEGNIQPVTLGPHAVLCAPPSGDGFTAGDWKFVEPSAQSLQFVAGRIDDTKKELRELGRQPLTALAGVTIIAAAYASDKANSALQAWTLMLRDALENALKLTAKWINDPTEPEVRLKMDWVTDPDGTVAPQLRGMRQDRDLSQRTYWEELQRHGVLSPEFDADEEEQRLMDEVPVATGADAIGALDGIGDLNPAEPPRSPGPVVN